MNKILRKLPSDVSEKVVEIFSNQSKRLGILMLVHSVFINYAINVSFEVGEPKKKVSKTRTTMIILRI